MRSDEEDWKRHPVWPHLAVSTHGRVVNTRTGNAIGTGTDGRGYHRAYLRRGQAVGVAVLVLETFIGPRPPRHDADHRNHDTTDNSLENLRWRPEGENRADHHRTSPPSCPQDHAYTAEDRNSRGHRRCRTCARDATARWRSRRQAT